MIHYNINNHSSIPPDPFPPQVSEASRMAYLATSRPPWAIVRRVAEDCFHLSLASSPGEASGRVWLGTAEELSSIFPTILPIPSPPTMAPPGWPNLVPTPLGALPRLVLEGKPPPPSTPSLEGFLDL